MLAAIAGVFAAVLRLIMMLYSGNNADVISVILDSLVIYILYAALYQFLSGVMGEDYLPDMLFTMLMADLISNLVSLAICNKMSDERRGCSLLRRFVLRSYLRSHRKIARCSTKSLQVLRPTSMPTSFSCKSQKSSWMR